MKDQRLLRLDPNGLTEVADLSSIATHHCNDMVVDATGRAYVGNFGFDHQAGEPPAKTNLAKDRGGRIETIAVEVPRAGLP